MASNNGVFNNIFVKKFGLNNPAVAFFKIKMLTCGVLLNSSVKPVNVAFLPMGEAPASEN